MRHEVFEVVEAARGLQVQLAASPSNLNCVRIGGDRSEFPSRLWRLGKALEAFDAAGSPGTAEHREEANGTMDPVRLKVALDGVFRWMRSMSLDVTEPYELVAEALGVPVPQGKTSGTYRPVPKFAPNGFRKTVKVNPLLILDPKLGEQISLNNLARKELSAQMTESSLGAASTATRASAR